MPVLSSLFLSFIMVFAPMLPPADKESKEFRYPDRDAAITITADDFGDVKEEWRGEDYYYSTTIGDGIICSVLFYKLNEEEQKGLAGMRGRMPGSPLISPAYPLAYFSANAKLGKLETMKENWGDPSGDFMYRQAHIGEMQGMELNQKNMYAYGMFSSDLFVSVHISKVMCTPQDSIAMRAIVEAVQKTK